MELVTAGIRNFMRLGEVDLQLSGQGLVLIQGVNRSDSSAASNGAGKSSVPDALCWCVYGETARGESGDAIVNRFVGKNTHVQTVWHDNGTWYRIDRYRKHAAKKNSVEVYQSDNPEFQDALDLTQGTKTQEVIDRILGCTLPIFRAAVYAGQEQMPDLPSMTDKQLKLMVEEGAGLSQLASAYERVLKRGTGLERLQDHKEADLRTLEGRAQDAQVTLNRLNDEHRRWLVEQEVVIRDLQQQVDHMETNLGLLSKRAISENAPRRQRLVKELQELETQLASHSTKIAECNRLYQIASSTMADRMAAEGVAKSIAQRVVGFKVSAEQVDKRVGTSCTECGKVYGKADIHHASVLAWEKVQAGKKEVEEAIARVRDTARIAQEAATAAEACRVTLPDVTAINVAAMHLRADMQKIDEEDREVRDLGLKLNETKQALEEAKRATSPHESMAKMYEDQVGSLTRQREEAFTAFESVRTEVELNRRAAEVFGPAGVRARILDTITPYLNERTAEYLGLLSDGNIQATWSTLTRTAKGDLREKFQIEVSKLDGAASFAGLSGGEKRKVRLATALAYQDMVAARAQKPIRFFVADEVDHALDGAALERLMAILEQKAKECGTVLVISHNELSDWVPSVTTVINEGGVSRLEGCLKREV